MDRELARTNPQFEDLVNDSGPFDKWTANPVLVIGNLFDPATRYQGAVTASTLLPNSRLLTVHAWGHTSLFLSGCVGIILLLLPFRLMPPPPPDRCCPSRSQAGHRSSASCRR